MTTIDWSHTWRHSVPDMLGARWSKLVCRAFLRYIPNNAQVLEIGCGSGKIIAQAVRTRAARGVGMDVNLPSADSARRVAAYLGVTCDSVCGSGFSTPFADNTFDVVLSEGVIEHFEPSQTRAMVAEHVRVCRPGGLVLISVPNLLNFPLTYHKWRVGDQYHVYPERSYTTWGLVRLLADHGLTPVACDGFAPSMGVEWYIWKANPLRWLDSVPIPWLYALIGFETLVVARKPSSRTLASLAK